MTFSRFYAIAQIEYCRNFIFKRHFPIHKIFERSSSHISQWNTQTITARCPDTRASITMSQSTSRGAGIPAARNPFASGYQRSSSRFSNSFRCSTAVSDSFAGESNHVRLSRTCLAWSFPQAGVALDGSMTLVGRSVSLRQGIADHRHQVAELVRLANEAL